MATVDGGALSWPYSEGTNVKYMFAVNGGHTFPSSPRAGE